MYIALGATSLCCDIRYTQSSLWFHDISILMRYAVLVTETS